MAGITAHSEQGDDVRAVWRRKALVLFLTIVGVAIGLSSFLPAAPRLIWNYTPSVPVGLYALAQQLPTRGDLLAINVSGEPRRLLEKSGALAPEHLLLKPLTGIHGDVVCRTGAVVTVNNAVVAHARDATRTDRKLPSWSGCRILEPHEILLIGDHPLSFDSRYFGPVDLDDVVGVARPLVLLASAVGDQ